MTQQNNPIPHNNPTAQGIQSQTMPERGRETSLAALATFVEPQKVNTLLARLRNELSSCDDARLILFAVQAKQIEGIAFEMRGMIARELQRRVETRQTGGRGKMDTDGAGITNILRDLAQRSGLSYSTLMNDARIYRIFFESERQTPLAGERSLPRDYYLTALGLVKPFGEEMARGEVSKIGERLAAGDRYTREQFREDVRALVGKQSEKANGGKDETGRDDGFLLQERIAKTAKTALEKIVRTTKRTRAEVVETALLNMYEIQSSITKQAKTPTSSRAVEVPPTRNRVSNIIELIESDDILDVPQNSTPVRSMVVGATDLATDDANTLF